MATVSEQERVKEVIVESRIAKVLSLRTDSIVMLEALDAISDFYTSSKKERLKLALMVEFQLFVLQMMEKPERILDETLNCRMWNTERSFSRSCQE